MSELCAGCTCDCCPLYERCGGVCQDGQQAASAEREAEEALPFVWMEDED